MRLLPRLRMKNHRHDDSLEQSPIRLTISRICQVCGAFSFGDLIETRGDGLAEASVVSRQSISLVPAELGRTDAARFAVQPAEADDRADAHSELLRNFRDSSAILRCPNYPLTQIL